MSASNGDRAGDGKSLWSRMASEMRMDGGGGGTNSFVTGTPRRKPAAFNPPASARGGLGQRNIIQTRICSRFVN